jgi:23S rRNA (guanosine2251-2'-O)-methyltransferase
MSSPKVLFGFHAVGVRLKTAPNPSSKSISRLRAAMRACASFWSAKEAGVRLIEADALRIAKLAGSHGHQGVAARVEVKDTRTLDELLDDLEEEVKAPLLLVLDGVTDPHNLGACLRVADGAGVHAVIAPKDHAAGINATVAKVASGAAETVPYFMVTNLARTLKELKERGIWIIGTSGDADKHLYQMDLTGPTALVLGAEGDGMRQLTRKTCDALVSIPMQGAVESLNVSVASGYACMRRCASVWPQPWRSRPEPAGPAAESESKARLREQWRLFACGRTVLRRPADRLAS